MLRGAPIAVLGSDSVFGRAVLSCFAREQVVTRGVEAVSLGDPNAIAASLAGSRVVVFCRPEVSERATRATLLEHYVAGTENVLAAVRHAGASRLVIMSSADATLSVQHRVFLAEGDYVRPVALALPHAIAVADDIALAAATKGFETVVLRPAWLWGPRLPSMESVLAEARAGGVSLVGRGATYFATAYIENAAFACVRAAMAPALPETQRTFYVSDEETLSAREFFARLSDALGTPAPRLGLPFALAWALVKLRSAVAPGRLTAEDVLRRGRSTLFNTQAARDVLAYAPQLTVAEGLTRVRDWASAAPRPTH